MKRTKVKALNSRTSVSSRDRARVKSRDRAKMTNNVVVTLVVSSRMKVKTKRENRRSYGGPGQLPEGKNSGAVSEETVRQAFLLPIASGICLRGDRKMGKKNGKNGIADLSRLN